LEKVFCALILSLDRGEMLGKGKGWRKYHEITSHLKEEKDAAEWEWKKKRNDSKKNYARIETRLRLKEKSKKQSVKGNIWGTLRE